MSFAATAPVPVKVLWMDDDPEPIENYRTLIESERGTHFLVIDIVTSVREAREKLKTDQYSGLIVDCKMGHYAMDDSENGARLLHEWNEDNKHFPTFVYSGFISDNHFKRYLAESHPIKMVNKAETSIERPVSAHWFIKAIREAGENYNEVKGYRPEWITFKEFIAQPQKYDAETSRHWKKHGHWIDAKMKADNLIWSVVCGDKIVDGSDDLFDFPDDKRLMEYGNQYNLIPFPYSNPSLPEDIQVTARDGCVWNKTSQKNDYYPAFVATIDKTELTDDFDTGAQHTFVSDEVVEAGLFDRWRDSEVPHLGKDFKLITKNIELTLVDSAGVTRSRSIPVIVIKDWRRSSFTHFNDKRKVLFGRDILRAFEIEISLNSQKRITRIRFL